MKEDRKVTDWTCDRCKASAQTEIPDLEPTMSQLLAEDRGAEHAAAPLPDGWAHTSIYWAQGSTWTQDLCSDCAEIVDGVMAQRYGVYDPERYTISPKRPKKAAKKSA